MAALLLNPEDRRTKKAKLESIELPERTFYRWMRDRRYVDYINSQLDQYIDGELADVWRALINQCKRGNIQAIKLLFEMKRMYPGSQKDDW
jgi:hypothetical protein